MAGEFGLCPAYQTATKTWVDIDCYYGRMPSGITATEPTNYVLQVDPVPSPTNKGPQIILKPVPAPRGLKIKKKPPQPRQPAVLVTPQPQQPAVLVTPQPQPAVFITTPKTQQPQPAPSTSPFILRFRTAEQQPSTHVANVPAQVPTQPSAQPPTQSPQVEPAAESNNVAGYFVFNSRYKPEDNPPTRDNYDATSASATGMSDPMLAYRSCWPPHRGPRGTPEYGYNYGYNIHPQPTNPRTPWRPISPPPGRPRSTPPALGPPLPLPAPGRPRSPPPPIKRSTPQQIYAPVLFGSDNIYS